MLIRLFDKFAFYFLIFLLVVLSLSTLRNYQRIKRVDDQIRSKEEQVEKVRKEGEELKKKLETAQSDLFVEKQLRDKLGMVKEGEIVVILPSDDILRSIVPRYEEEEEIVIEPNWKKWAKLFL